MLPRADDDSRNLHPGSSQLLAGRRAGAIRKLGAARVAGKHWMGPQAEAESAVNGAQATTYPPVPLGQRKAWSAFLKVLTEGAAKKADLINLPRPRALCLGRQNACPV